MRSIKTLSQFDYYHQLASVQGLALVYYTAPACGTCHQLKRALTLYLQVHDDVEVFEVDAVHEAGLVNSFEVFHLPSMFLYQSGVFHCELHSEAHPEKLRLAIQEALLRAPEEEP